ncbi:hypothetical protein PA15_0306525 [Pseudomonas aeruginosa HB15]|nr:hypothetical protein PA15_0306525 [Pseudomonas aeruginosa HB15]
MPRFFLIVSGPDQVAGIEAPGGFHRVAHLEELGPAGRGVGQQGFQALAVLQLDDVQGHVAQVEQFGDAAAEVHLVAVGGDALRQADLLRPQGQHAGLAGLGVEGFQRLDLAQAPEIDAHAFAVDRLDCGVEQVALADEVGDETTAREAVDGFRGVQLLHPALVHHRDAVRQRQGFALIVGDIDEGDADVLLQVDQFDLHFFAQLGVQRRQRFVEQQQARPVDQRAGDRHALALAAGKLCRHAPALVRQAHVLQGLFDAGVDLALRHSGHLQREGDVLRHAHVREQRVALEHRMHRALLRLDAGEVLAVEADLAAVRLVEAGEHAQEGGLAAPGRAEEGEEFAGVDRQADIVDGGEVAEAAGHVADLEQGGRHSSGEAVRSAGGAGCPVSKKGADYRDRIPL